MKFKQCVSKSLLGNEEKLVGIFLLCREIFWAFCKNILRENVKVQQNVKNRELTLMSCIALI